MSLCWIATDILGRKIDREALLEAAKILNFKCNENMANHVYEKLTPLKERFQQLHGKTSDPISLRNVAPPLADTAVLSTNLQEPCVKTEVIEISDHEENKESKDKIGVHKNQKKLRKVQKCIEKRKTQVCRRQDKEFQEFNKLWKVKREKLEEEQAAELAVFRAIHRPSGTKMEKFIEENNKFCQALQYLICLNELERRALEKKHADEMEEENRKCEAWLAGAEAKYGRGGSTTINDANTHELESGNDAKNSGSTSSAPPSNIAADALVIDVSGDGEIEVVNNEPVHMQVAIPFKDEPATTNVSLQNPNDLAAAEVDYNVPTVNGILSTNRDTKTDSMILGSHVDPLPEFEGGVPVSAEQFEAAKISSQDPKDVSAAEATSNGHKVDEIQSTNRGTGADSGLLENHGGSLPQDGLLNGGMDLTDDPLMLLDNSGDTGVQPDLCQNPVASSHECDVPAVSVDNPGLEAASLSDCQVDSEQSDILANIMDSADGDNHFESHASEGPGSMPLEQLGLGNADDVTNTAGSHNQTLSKVAGNAAECLSGDVLPVIIEEHERVICPNPGDTRVQPDLCQNPVASSHECDDSAVSVDNPGLEAASLSDCQVDSEQSDLDANIMDSADGDNHFESHASEGPGNMPHEQLGLGNADDVTNTAGSHDQTSSEVAGNAAEFQNGDVLPVVQLNGGASQNPASISRAPTIAVETQHLPVLHPGPNSVELPQPQAAWNQRLRMIAGPLQGEIDKMLKDREQMIKMHEDAKLHLRAECEKEITEITNQIRHKYAEKVKDAESSYLAKRTEIEANESKVFMNKLLAEAFRSKCLDFRPSGAPVAYPGMPCVSLQQHTQLVPSSSSLRNSPVSQPASAHNQTVNPAHRFSSVGSSSSSTSQTGVVQQQTLYPPSAHSTHRPTNLSGIPSRPPPLQVGSLTPNVVSSRVGGSTDIRAPAPHLQPFRPSTSVSLSSPSTLPLPPLQQPVTSQVPRSTDNPPAPQPGPSSNGRVSYGGAHISVVKLLVPVSNNKADDVSGSKAAGGTSSILSDVICLSDDDN